MIDKIHHYFPEEVIEAFGWTLFHSLWQIGTIAIALVIVLVLLRKHSARIKYFLAFLALASTLIWSAGTWHSAYIHAVKKKEIREKILSNPEIITKLLKEKTIQQETAPLTRKSVNLNNIKFRAKLQQFVPIMFLLWLIGVVSFLFRMMGGMIYLMQLRSKYTTTIEKKWLEKINHCINRLQIHRKVEILQSSLAKVPMALGYFKPVLLVPASLISGLSTKEIEAVIAHELAHIKRNDFLFNIIQTIIETLFFYHPAIWIISRIIRNERENSCDDLALKITQDKISYIKALAASQTLFASKPQPAVAFASKGGLLNRVKRIQNNTYMNKNGYEGFIATSLVFISIILLSFTFDRSDPKDEDYFNRETTLQQPAPADTIKMKKKHSVKIVKSKKNKGDSLDIIVKTVNEELDEVPEEMQQLIEIAYTTDNDSLVDVIMQSFDIAMKEMDKAMYKVDINMKDFDASMEDFDLDMKDFEADMEDFDVSMQNFDSIMKDKHKIVMYHNPISSDSLLKDIEIEVIIKDAMKESKKAMKEAEKAMKKHKETIVIKQKALEEAQAALENLDIDSLIAVAKTEAEIHEKNSGYEIVIKHKEALKKLEEAEIEKIIEEAMEAAKEAENVHRKKVIIQSSGEDNPDISKESEAEMEKQLIELEIE